MEQSTRARSRLAALLQGGRRLLRNQVFSMFLILILIWVVLALLSPYFFTVTNLFEITLQSAVFAIIAAGETFVIFSGGIDLSVGSVFAVASIIGGMFFKATGSVLLAVVTALATGIVAGLVSGLFISRLRVPPFVATLGMMGIARGLALIAVNGIPIYGLTKAFMWIGQGRLATVIPVPTLLVVAVFILSYFTLRYTRFGRFAYAIGSNSESARLSGVNVGGVILGIYAVSGSLSALAGIIESARLGTVQPAGGDGYELLAIGAVVIGGTSLFGGEGHILGTLIGALIVTTIRNGLNILGVYAFWQYVVNGLIIILAVAIDQVRRGR
jgi:ribose/xylose/arabinose/galactoside ABC-type transport system permease subunit